MIKISNNWQTQTSSLSHRLSPNCTLRNLAGFAAQAIFVDSSQSQTRDGFSFDVIGKSLLQTSYPMALSEQKYRDARSSLPATQERHPELVSGSAQAGRNSTSSGRNAAGTEIGTRYRYIDDTPLVPMTEAGKANGTNAASSASGAKTRSRPNNEYVLYSYGEPVGMTNDSGTSYFGTDILGSVRNVTDKYGTVQADYSYDAFGSPYLGNLENDIGFGYCGKSYDVGTGLYDYGFRDYSPVNARFTTIDPIRDGSNWFSYCMNDAVNYVDLWGLEQNEQQKKFTKFLSNMQKYENHPDIKSHTSIVVERSPNDDGENGNYYQSTESVTVYGVKLNQIPVQSTADWQQGVDKGLGRTIPLGVYSGTLLNKSGSFNEAISITGNGVNEKEAVLFHPNVKTAKGETVPYSQDERPYSLACQISHLNDFNEVTSILKDLGFEYGEGTNAWAKGDTLKVEIKAIEENSKCETKKSK